ncbi:MAG: DUF167 domain-containing protein [Anaerolineales bacterium]|jgi:uncharacterized protein YggU (UPF0235/DUF167 family)
MKARKHRLHDGKIGAALAIRVMPQAQSDELVRAGSDGSLQIHLTAPMIEEKLNKALIEFLAAILDIPARRVQIVAGTDGLDKLVTIDDMDAESLQRKIEAKLKI